PRHGRTCVLGSVAFGLSCECRLLKRLNADGRRFASGGRGALPTGRQRPCASFAIEIDSFVVVLRSPRIDLVVEGSGRHLHLGLGGHPDRARAKGGISGLGPQPTGVGRGSPPFGMGPLEVLLPPMRLAALGFGESPELSDILSRIGRLSRGDNLVEIFETFRIVAPPKSGSRLLEALDARPRGAQSCAYSRDELVILGMRCPLLPLSEIGRLQTSEFERQSHLLDQDRMKNASLHSLRRFRL